MGTCWNWKADNIMNEYKKTICKEMTRLASIPKSIFLGQNICYGSQHYGTMIHIAENKKIELPGAEEVQMGMAIGLSLQGYLPISIYQRIDFLLRSMDQIVNHLDKIKLMSNNEFSPKVIIRTTIGSKKPFNAGPQHTQDLTKLFQQAVSFPVIKVTTPQEIIDTYELAINLNDSIMIIEKQDLFRGEK